MSGTDLLAQAEQLQQQIAGHKRVIRTEREALQQKAASLEALKARCRALGIGFVVQERETCREPH